MRAIEKAPEGAIKNNQFDNTTQSLVLSMLTTYPQDRYMLAMAVGITEREFRSTVRELRLKGYPIIATSKGSGYRLGTKDEARLNARELRSRAYDLLRTAEALDKANEVVK